MTARNPFAGDHTGEPAGATCFPPPQAPFPPTTRQLELLRFVTGWQEAHAGTSPSIRAMQAGLGVTGMRTIYNLLRGLEERGLIRRHAHGIEILRAPPIPRTPDGAPLRVVKIEAPHFPDNFGTGEA